MRLHRVKMMTYNETSKIFDIFFFRIILFCSDGPGDAKFKVSGLKVINLRVPEEIEFNSKKFEPGAGNQYQR